MFLYRNILKGAASLVFATIIMTPAASAKDFAVKGPSCTKSYGSLYIDKGANTDAWRAAKTGDPASFVEAMVVQSGCFTVTNSRHSAKYILTAGLLTKDQYDEGKSAFQSRDIPGSTPGTALGAVIGYQQNIGQNQ